MLTILERKAGKLFLTNIITRFVVGVLFNKDDDQSVHVDHHARC